MPRIPSAAGNLERRKETSEIKPPPPAERQIRAQPLCIPSAGHLRQMSHRAPGIFIRGPPIAGTGSGTTAVQHRPQGAGLCLDTQRWPLLTVSPKMPLPPPGGGTLRSTGSDAGQGSKSHLHSAGRGMLCHVQGRALRLFGVTHKNGGGARPPQPAAHAGRQAARSHPELFVRVWLSHKSGALTV